MTFRIHSSSIRSLPAAKYGSHMEELSFPSPGLANTRTKPRTTLTQARSDGNRCNEDLPAANETYSFKTDVGTAPEAQTKPPELVPSGIH